MKRIAVCLSYVLLSVMSPVLAAQDNTKPDGVKADVATTPIKVQVVFSEFDGKKKTKSLPYTLYHNTAHGSDLRPDFTRLRLTWKVPVATDSSHGSWQYFDLATKLDCRAVRNDQGQFLVELNVERSWVDLDPILQLEANRADHEAHSERTLGQPTIRNMSSNLYLSLRDGQTMETIAATDPTTGRVVVVEVTLNALK